MAKKIKFNAFTLIELLSVLVILSIVLLIAVPLISDIINKAKESAIEKDVAILEGSARRYMMLKDEYNPETGEIYIISLKELIDENHINKIISPYDKSVECDGAVIITKDTYDYLYQGHINCGGYVSSSILSIYQELDNAVEKGAIEELKTNIGLLPIANETTTLNIVTDLNLNITDPMDPEDNDVTGTVIINNGTSITGDGTTTEINGSTYEVIADIIVKDENSDSVYENQEVISVNGSETVIEPPVQLVNDVTDTTPGVLAGTGSNTTPYLIESIEDLVYITQNMTQTYSHNGKYFSLTTDLDFNYAGSYSNPSSTTYGDINGNGTIEGLKTELTTEKGWKPIGNSTYTFAGYFNGNRKIIYNLYINRTAENYVGLFGYIGNDFQNVRLKNINVKGFNYTGGFAGYIYSADNNNCEITGNIVGNNYVGIAFGNIAATSFSRYITTTGNVTGADYVGGISGGNFPGITTGVYTGGNIVATGSNVGRVFGEAGSSPAQYFSVFANKDVTINGSILSNPSSYHKNGADITSLSDITNINDLESIYDTYIGGDNDLDGYYWDYNESGVLVERKTSEYPLTFDLAGTGISTDPYIIEDYNDLRMASLKTNKYYKLNNNIDLSGKKFYTLGSLQNKFTGNVDGNAKTISNLSLETKFSSNIGFVGYSNGIIKGLSLTNVKISGKNRVGGIAGFTDNIISDVRVSGEVSGYDYVALGIGRNETVNKDTISISVEGNVIGNSYVGALTGYMYAQKVAGIYTGGTIVAGGTNVYRSVGYKYLSGTINAKALSSITINESTVTNTLITSTSGADITASDLLSSATYTTIGFNFTDETLKYIWYIDNGVAKLRRGTSS